jgi:hypothetical protein
LSTGPSRSDGQRGASSDGGEGVTLDRATLREVARLLAKRLDEVVAYGAGGCPTCRDAEARAFLARLGGFGEGA